MNELRELPAVEQLLQTRAAAELVARYGRPLTLEALRNVLDDLREKVRAGQTLPPRDGILKRCEERLEEWLRPTLLPVINATGVVLHTNLGRAPLSQAALQALRTLGGEFSTLEFDLEKGVRGSRTVHAESLLCRLTGAEAALVVNNNAAALLVALGALARRRKVLISRTQLVEIGGGFRVPDVMEQSGAHLLEIGTTNRVHLEDFRLALEQDHPALVLHVHSSNFRIIGFTTEPTLAEIVQFAHAQGVPVLDDLGSGALMDTVRFGLAHEPTVQESLAAGADVVCFSGDKLLGGPQAGIILGRRDLIAKIKKHPLARAVRADKLCLAALTATLLHYLKDEAEREIPVWRMISAPAEMLKARAELWRSRVGEGEVIEARSTVGGGSLPEETLATYVLALKVSQPNRFLARLRHANPAIIARVENERVLFDPRTVLPEQDGALLVGVQNALNRPLKIIKEA